MRREARLCIDCGWQLNTLCDNVVCWPVGIAAPRPPCVKQFDSLRHPR